MGINRVLIIVEQPGFNPLNRFSAVAAVVYSFADLLQNSGYDVYLNEHKISLLENDEVSVSTQSNALRYRILYRFIPKRIREFLKDVIYFRKLKKMRARLEALPEPDIIIGWISYGSSISADLSKKWGVPLVSIFDHPINEEYKFLFGFHSLFKKRIDRHEKRMLSNARAIIAYSPSVKEYISKEVDIANIPVYYMAFTDFKRMSFEKYSRNYDIIRFAYIGSFFNWHKLNDLIDAFEEVHLQGHVFELYLVGNGPEYNAIKHRISSLTWKDKIRLTGALDGEQLNSLLRKLHVGIIPNALWFQGPVKLFQYSAERLCIISKNTPTIRFLFRGAQGCLFFDTLEDLVGKITFLLLNKEKTVGFGEETQRFVKENYDKANYLSFFEKIFSNL